MALLKKKVFVHQLFITVTNPKANQPIHKNVYLQLSVLAYSKPSSLFWPLVVIGWKHMVVQTTHLLARDKWQEKVEDVIDYVLWKSVPNDPKTSQEDQSLKASSAFQQHHPS